MKSAGWIIAAALIALPMSGAQARDLDPLNPQDAVEITKRVQCPADDQETVVFSFSGDVYGRIRGEKDTHLFRAIGMNIRRCPEIIDDEQGIGYRVISREIVLYLDPQTGEILRQWDNPWTGETVEVIHAASDPVNSRPFLPFDENGAPFTLPTMRFQGDWALWKNETTQFYTNPLAGDYQDYVGGSFQGLEIFDFAMRAERLLDTVNFPTAYPAISWVRLTRWLPWMKMDDRSGTVVFNAMGTKLTDGLEGLPQLLKNEIALNYPEFTTAPPADDPRPNATGWTVTKDWIDRQREEVNAAITVPEAGR